MKNCYTKDSLQQTILKTHTHTHGWTALHIIDAGSTKGKGIQGRFFLLYPFRLNGESAREHQGALTLGLWEREVGRAGVCFSGGYLVPSCLACSRVPQSPLTLGKACEGGRNKGKKFGSGDMFSLK